MRTGWMKLLYLLLLLIAALFSILYTEAFSVFLLIILLILPILMLLSVCYMRLHLHATLVPVQESLHRNQKEKLQLVIENRGFLPIGKAAASVACMTAGADVLYPVQLSFPIPARNTITVTFHVTAKHCGSAQFSLQWLCIADYLHLFRWKLRRHPVIETAVLPLGPKQLTELQVPGSLTDEDSTLFAKNRAGDDPSEVYKIREYQPGDIPKRIHWKLSARSDTVWVKEYSAPIQQRAVLLIDYMLPEECSAGAALDALDVCLEAAYALACSLVAQKLPFSIYWMDTKTEKLAWNEIHSAAELHDTLFTMLKQAPNRPEQGLLEQAAQQDAVHKTQALFYFSPMLQEAEYAALSQTFSRHNACAVDVLGTITEADTIPVLHAAMETLPEVMQQLRNIHSRR